MFKIVISNHGNHFCNPLLKLSDREYATRHEACEAIYDALYDVISGENGCAMVDPPDWNLFGDDDAYLQAKDRYVSSCCDYILREGYATEDGVTATVEEVAG